MMKKSFKAKTVLLALSLFAASPVWPVAANENNKVQIVTEKVPQEARAIARYAMESDLSFYNKNMTEEEKKLGGQRLTLGDAFSLYERKKDGSFISNDFFFFPVYENDEVLFVIEVMHDEKGWGTNTSQPPSWIRDLENKSGNYRIYVEHTEQGTVPFTALEIDPEKLTEDESLSLLYPAKNHHNACLYRLYNSNNGEHFYTREATEMQRLVDLGWQAEGMGWVAALSGQAVYRLYNPNSGEHHFTTDENERKVLIEAGWKDEGTGFYSDSGQQTAVYRLFNPNSRDAGSHMYTTSKNEADQLVKMGWKDEGIGWYAELEGVSGLQ